MSTSVLPGARPAPSRLRRGLDGWRTAEWLLAAFCIVMVAARIRLGGGLVVADPLAWLLAPLWLPVLRRYRGARTLLVVGLVACCASWVLTRYASVDHHVSMKLNSQIIKVIASMLTGTGLLLWAREHVRMPHLLALFGIGLLIAGPSSAKLFAQNPWKFGFSIPVTIIVVGLVGSQKRPRATLGALAFFGLLCVLTDARSNLSVLLLTIVLIGWRLMPGVRSRRSTVLGTLSALAAVAAAAYYGLQAAILDGVLGEETRARSEEQLRTSGSLLLGGRPELGASTALFQHRPMGFGGGTFLNSIDLTAAKNGMATLGYDPNNGYVERFMFGRGTELHSVLFDLWSWCGIAGLVFALLVAINVLVILGHQLNHSPVSGAAVVFVALLTLWNLPFSPWLASVPIMVLVLAAGLPRRPSTLPQLRRESPDEGLVDYV
ncbi:hypothetical protein [Luteococcus peritonei]|uniref:O-antigen ligase family protein n=1 Tax=Luteococcus peritonei TaxID=88874 RepID=A0ABW4RSC5_9ACTN